MTGNFESHCNLIMDIQFAFLALFVFDVEDLNIMFKSFLQVTFSINMIQEQKCC